MRRHSPSQETPGPFRAWRAATALWTLLVVLIFPVAAAAKSGQDPTSDRRRLMKISLEELVNAEESSVARMRQKLSDTAASAPVLGNEDIRHDRDHPWSRRDDAGRQC